MIDIHNHVIFEFDDGAKSLEESLDMLKMAADQGISDVFATSHFNEVLNPKMEEDYFRKLKVLQEETQQHGIPVRVHSGSEIFFHHYMEQTIKKRRTSTLGDQGLYVLMEFPLYLLPSGVEETLFKLNMEGYIPIVAHPERYSALHERPEKILNFIRFGGLLQVNAGSLLGDFGRTVKKIATWLVENQYVHFIASDAHSKGGRSFKLAKAAAMLEEHCDKSYIESIVTHNPQKIIDHEKLEKLTIPETAPPSENSLLQRVKQRLRLAR